MAENSLYRAGALAEQTEARRGSYIMNTDPVGKGLQAYHQMRDQGQQDQQLDMQRQNLEFNQGQAVQRANFIEQQEATRNEQWQQGYDLKLRRAALDELEAEQQTIYNQQRIQSIHQTMDLREREMGLSAQRMQLDMARYQMRQQMDIEDFNSGYQRRMRPTDDGGVETSVMMDGRMKRMRFGPETPTAQRYAAEQRSATAQAAGKAYKAEQGPYDEYRSVAQERISTQMKAAVDPITGHVKLDNYPGGSNGFARDVAVAYGHPEAIRADFHINQLAEQLQQQRGLSWEEAREAAEVVWMRSQEQGQ